MKNILKRVYIVLGLFGFNPLKFINLFRGLPSYLADYLKFKKQMQLDGNFIFGRSYPILDDKFVASGTMKGHYFHQDLLIARKIFENKPLKHIDIGSRIDGFIAHVAVFREIEVFDIRPQENNVKNIIYRNADLMKIQDDLTEYCDSISSLHALEHFGLGRYGDSIDANGHIKGIESIYRILKNEGVFYFSVPIGNQRVEFNAHRIFSLEYLLKVLSNKFIVKSFSYVDDAGTLFENAELSKESIASNFNCTYGCGIFELIKYSSFYERKNIYGK